MKAGNYPPAPSMLSCPGFDANALRKGQRNVGKNGFTLVEILAVIAVVAILAAILVPAIANMRGRAMMSASSSNLRQLSNAVGLYANENNGYPPFEIDSANRPEKRTWSRALSPYLNVNVQNWTDLIGKQPVGVYNNPATSKVARSGNIADYGINNRLTGHHIDQGRYKLSMVTEPSRVFLFGETHNCDRAIRDGWLTMSELHPGGLVQVVYVDGSVAALKPEVIYSQNNQNAEPWGWPGRSNQIPQKLP